MDKDSILRKIQKCMALAGSAEPAEAAAALRQAQALMREHGISDLEVTAASVQEMPVRARADNPTMHESLTASMVADAFGCRLIFSNGFVHGPRWLLVGCSPNVDVAAYALQVLLRLLFKARKDYIAAKLKRCGPKNKRARADAFCMGWAHAASRAVSNMERTDEQDKAIEAFMSLNHPDLDSLKPREPRAARGDTWADRAAGHIAGQGVQLHQGVGAAAAPLMLEG
ncbi:hypothetical protein C1I89_33695 [Achromobacter pulmonis]|uniref:Uncharacterized protein n=2 Tax=Achromobacter pulmonis TaxID=1389932 RepID=A0A2N8K862_9BURK|nr:hypothetical protein C1I89_33695 [Achromobacter pulmonis]